MLQKQNLPIALNSPMNTKVDEKLTNQEIFTYHYNSRFQKIGSLTKRNGYENKSPTGSLDIQKCLNTSSGLLGLCSPFANTSSYYRSYDDEFVQIIDSNTDEDYSSSLSCEFDGRNIGTMSFNVVSVDYDRRDNIEVYVSDPENDQSGMITLYDSVTETRKVKFLANPSKFSMIRIFEKADGTKYIAVCYEDPTIANRLRIEVYDLNLAIVLNTSVTNLATGALCKSMCVYENDYSFVIVYKSNSAANNLRILQVDETGILQNSSVATSVNVKLTCSCQAVIHTSSPDVVFIAYMEDSASTDNPRFFSFNLSTLAISAADREVTMGTDNYSQLTFNFLTSGTVGVAASNLENNTDSKFTDFCVHTIATGTETSYIRMFGMSLYSAMQEFSSTKVVCVGTTVGYSPITPARNQVGNTMYVLTFTSGSIEVAATFNVTTASRVIRTDGYINTNLVKDDFKYYSASMRVVRLESGTATEDEVNAIYGFNFNANTDYYQKNFLSKLGQNHFISSGLVLEYDGKNIYRSGFLTRAHVVNVTTNAGVGITAGTYGFLTVFERYDANGQRLQGAPSDPLSLVLGGAVLSFNLITFNPIVGDPAVKIAVYMTTAGGSIYYRLTSSTFLTNTFSTTFVITDVPTGDEEAIYTTGGVLPNDNPSPSKYLVSHQERLFSIDADYPNQISYTKKVAIGSTAEWSDFFKIYLSASDVKRNNELVGLASINEKLIILRRSSIYYILGDGPNSLGEQNNFTEPELVTSDVGCIEAQSIISTPKGVMFKTAKGIYLLDPSMQDTYIGAPVEEFNSEEIISSIVIEPKNIACFMTTSRVLVYDYLLDMWAIDTIEGVSMSVYNNKPVVVESTNVVSFESEDYADTFGATTSSISMAVETGWIKTSGIQDFGRIVNALILGKYKSEHALRVDVYYDYVETVANSYDLTHNVLQSVYQFKVQLKKQKCEAIKFKIYDVPVDNGESCELTNLTLELGVKKGTYKTPASRNY